MISSKKTRMNRIFDDLRKENERLKHIIRRQRAIIKSPKDIIVFALDKNYRYLDFTPTHKKTMKEIWGVDIQLGENILDYIKNKEDRKKAKENFDRALRGESFIIQEEYGNNDFKRLFYEDRYSPIIDKNRIIGLSVYVINITERKLAEKKLKESEERFRLAFRTSPDSITISLLSDGTYLDINKGFTRITGYTRKEVIGKKPEKLNIWYDFNERTRLIEKLKSKKTVSNFPARFYKKNGEIIYALMSASVMELNQQQVILALSKDITKIHNAETSLRESETRYRTLFEMFNEAIFISDGKRIKDCNRAAVKMFGFRNKKEVINLNPLDISAPVQPNGKSSKELLDELARSFKRNDVTRFEWMHRKKNGVEFETEITISEVAIEGKPWFHAIIRDITEQKRAQKIQKAQYNIAHALVEREDIRSLFTFIQAELKGLISTRNLVLALFDNKNKRLHILYGKDEKDILPSSWDAHKSLTGHVVLSRKTILLKRKEIEKWIRKGKIIQIGSIPEVWLGIPLLNKNELIGVLIMQDYESADVFDTHIVNMLEVIAPEIASFIIHKQTQAERERLSAAIEQSAESVIITDNLGVIEYVNPAFERINGYSSREILGKKPNILKSGKHDQKFYNNLWDIISSGKVWSGRIVNKHKDGKLITEEMTISPIFDLRGKIAHYVAVKRDITRQLELEEQYRQAQKMESIGRLAGGVAHDFNNMLSVILGYSELGIRKLDINDKLYHILEEIHKAGQRSADLTAQLLAFARKQTIAPKVLNMNDAVGSILKMLRRLIGEDIDLNWKPGANLWLIKIDPAQLDQILANLCINSRDAISKKGQITIETANVTVDKEYSSTRLDAQPGRYVVLTVSDNGCGMDEETKKKIFEPFFTTKNLNEGTGLGLATVYGIVKQNEGFIDVYSEPSIGTSFKIYFPRYGEEVLLSQRETLDIIPFGKGEHILIVEDEEAILDMTRSMLESLGYKVSTTNNPANALKIIRDNSSQIDLIMTDVVMPGMNGRELVDKIQQKISNLKILYMSGYTINLLANQTVLEEGINLIPKPFTLKDLAVKVHKALHS